jgi:hypothetical protein
MIQYDAGNCQFQADVACQGRLRLLGEPGSGAAIPCEWLAR